MITSPASFDKQTLKTALNLAKSGSIEEAQALVARLNEDSLPTEDLRTLALIFSHCEKEHDAERVWEQICVRDDARSGDHYMLASTAMMLGHNERAIISLRREIEVSDRKVNANYFSVSAISLAFLLTDAGRKTEALDILGRLDGSESTYIHGVGVITKRDLLAKLRATN